MNVSKALCKVFFKSRKTHKQALKATVIPWCTTLMKCGKTVVITAKWSVKNLTSDFFFTEEYFKAKLQLHCHPNSGVPSRFSIKVHHLGDVCTYIRIPNQNSMGNSSSYKDTPFSNWINYLITNSEQLPLHLNWIIFYNKSNLSSCYNCNISRAAKSSEMPVNAE